MFRQLRLFNFYLCIGSILKLNSSERLYLWTFQVQPTDWSSDRMVHYLEVRKWSFHCIVLWVKAFEDRFKSTFIDQFFFKLWSNFVKLNTSDIINLGTLKLFPLTRNCTGDKQIASESRVIVIKPKIINTIDKSVKY
jgi:hypothetical protein